MLTAGAVLAGVRAVAPPPPETVGVLVAAHDLLIRARVRQVHRHQRRRREHRSAGHRAQLCDDLGDRRSSRERELDAITAECLGIGGEEQSGYGHEVNVGPG